ncbi:class I SAM-dependent methyltransferase [Desulfovibrio sp. OttesenSCG-928-I05]|nr:class I SAM-dependent methyltransferase [Desulfovibrio sp. OttesenSCG-928-I05]
MTRDQEIRQSEAWYATPMGRHVLFRERMLISHMLTSWPRRNHTLLEMGCGAGHFLELFWNAGFDVTAIDEQEESLSLAREKVGQRVTLRQGSLEHLPFDDDDFDFVTIVTTLEHMAYPETVLREAFRVATHGLLVLFFNSWSLYRCEGIFQNAVPARDNYWMSPLRLAQMITQTCGKRPNAFRSTMFRPSRFWRGEDPPRWSLGRTSVFPFGAVAAFRVDLSPLSGTTIKLAAGNPIQAVR